MRAVDIPPVDIPALREAVRKARDAATLGTEYDSRLREVLRLAKGADPRLRRAIADGLGPLYEIVISAHGLADIYAALCAPTVDRLAAIDRYLASCEEKGIHEQY